MEEQSPKKDHKEDSEILYQFNLSHLLKNFTDKLESIDNRIAKLEVPKKESSGRFFMEILKTLVGGWPAFGLLFLILFYSPMKEALNSIPDKVRNANEISVGGVSLKSTIKQVASVQGLTKLGDEIPLLSEFAIEVLLGAPDYYKSLISFTNSLDKKSFSSFNIPSNDVLKALVELETKGLIEVRGSLNHDTNDIISSTEIEKFVDEIKSDYPGSASQGYNNKESSWQLEKPIYTTESVPKFGWKLTEYGVKAVNIVLEAVSKELSENK